MSNFVWSLVVVGAVVCVGCVPISPVDHQAKPSQFAPSVVTALEQARTGTQSNAAWRAVYPEGYIHAFDGVEMALAPAGCFRMGDDPGGYDYDGNSWEKGVPDGGLVCFEEPFWIDRTEVTQADFARLNGRKAAKNAFAGDRRPVDNITWAEARDYCQQRGARLPSEAEWEYAARGVDGLFYPWGNEFDGERTVWNRDPAQATADVGGVAAGASWIGALDMSGNVWEWVNSLYLPYPYDAADGREFGSGIDRNGEVIPHVLRGSSWYGEVEFLHRATLRDWSDPTIATDIWGFRCARSVE